MAAAGLTNQADAQTAAAAAAKAVVAPKAPASHPPNGKKRYRPVRYGFDRAGGAGDESD
jgi:hypothetical protein